jgi:hypothetical protein
MTDLTLQNIKTQIPLLQAAIKKHLKVGCGKQAAYHIFAVSNFFTNDNHMKAELNKSMYSITANFGTYEHPCLIKHEIGLFSQDHQAINEAESFLKSFQQKMLWALLKNDEKTGKHIEARVSPEQGLNLTIIINGDKHSDICQQLDDVKGMINDGFRGNSGGSESVNFDYDITGEEYDIISDITCLVEDNNYIIFDSKGIIDADNCVDEIDAKWENRDSEYDSWETYLIHAEYVDLQHALENDEQTYHAISRQSGSIYSGEIVDILDVLRHEKHEFSLFKEIDRA